MLLDFTFQCIDQIPTSTSENTENLLITKAYWSAQLFSLSPFELSKRQEFHSKIASTIHDFSGPGAMCCEFLKVSVYPKIDHFSKQLVFAFSDRSYYDLSFKKNSMKKD